MEHFRNCLNMNMKQEVTEAGSIVGFTRGQFVAIEVIFRE